jgi:hypothetical protein
MRHSRNENTPAIDLSWYRGKQSNATEVIGQMDTASLAINGSGAAEVYVVQALISIDFLLVRTSCVW